MKVVTTPPEKMPRAGNRFSRWLGRIILRMLGWRLEGEFPNHSKMMIILAPHTSNWDFVVAMPVIMALGVKCSFLMKKEAFFWPFKNIFLSLGGIPLDRKAAGNTVEQVVRWYKKNDTCWVAITPEGTRRKVSQWKNGFIRIAHKANVPICLVAWDFPSKTMQVAKTWVSEGDYDREIEEMRRYCEQNFTGRFPDKQ